jgi:hypothetical protein
MLIIYIVNLVIYRINLVKFLCKTNNGPTSNGEINYVNIIIMAGVIRAKPTIVKLTVVKLLINFKILMAELTIIKLNMAKKMTDN